MLSNLRNKDLNALIHFHTLMEERSVTKAAARLHMSQSAVSATLARLRESLNDLLFYNKYRQMVPTPRAIKFYEATKPALSIISDAYLEDDSFDYDLENKSYNIGVTDFFQGVVTKRLLDVINSIAPHIQLNFINIPSCSSPLSVYRGITESLNDGGLDIIIHHDTAIFNDDEFEKEEILTDRWVFVAKESLQPIRSGNCDLELRPHLNTGLNYVDELIDDALTNSRKLASLSAYSEVPNIVLTNNYIGAIPKLAIASSILSTPSLSWTYPSFEIPDFRLFQFWSRKSKTDSSIEFLREIIADTCGQFKV
ncbi:MAG: LysR family transcriptional regulator [Pseudomonadales bacterium]|nr:LysR family transcriptional regulator [Pseudomonadales bacterium]